MARTPPAPEILRLEPDGRRLSRQRSRQVATARFLYALRGKDGRLGERPFESLYNHEMCVRR
jgi:hypothetical protein